MPKEPVRGAGCWLGVDHYRDNHRPTAQSAAEPGTDGSADDLLQLARVGDPVAGRIRQGLLKHGKYLIEDILVLGKATSLDLGAGSHISGGRVAYDDDRDEALVAQDATVLQEGLGGLAHG